MPLRDHKAGATRRDEPGDTSRWAVGALAGLVALVGGGFWAAHWFSEREKVTTDPQSLCPTSRALTSATVILLDVSDRLTAAQVGALKNSLERIQTQVPRFGLIEVYSVEPDTGHLSAPVVHLCSPGKGAEMNEVYQNPERTQKRWVQFSRTLSGELDRLMAAGATDRSPLFEALQSVALTTFGKPAYDGVTKRLVIVSDLLQNVPGKANHYAAVPRFEDFKRSDYFAQVRPSLDGVAIDVLYLRRAGIATQGDAHREFWERYFTDAGGQLDSFEQVYGDR